jgi:hypothetical protein
VAQELTASREANLYCWTGKTSEIEFLLSNDLGIVPLEVKSGRVTNSKSLGVFEARYHPERSYILSARNSEFKGKRCLAPIYAVGTIERDLANRA